MKIKNWSKFQHFKDRKPPWVKLYRDLLDDIEWHELDPKAAKVLTMLWLIASEDDGNIPSTKQLAFRLRMPEKETEVCISKLSHWLEQDDDSTISERYQDDALETERETEKEREKETKKATIVATPIGVSQEVWDSFVKQRKTKKAQITELVIAGIQREANKAGWSLENALNEIVVRNWQSFKADWVKEKQSHSERLSNSMSVLTNGLTTPKQPFWQTEEVKNERIL
jgi:hypothetical protein